MKKSYHSREVPTRLATMTRRTDEAWAVPAVDGIGSLPRNYPRSEGSSTDRNTSARNNRRTGREPGPDGRAGAGLRWLPSGTGQCVGARVTEPTTLFRRSVA